MLVISTDGGANPNPGPAGWGVVIRFSEKHTEEQAGYELHATNQQMELRAAIQGLRYRPGHQRRMRVDSRYVRKGITLWIAGWKVNGWLTTKNEPVANRELWEELDALNGPFVQWEWTKGHADDRDNNRADQLASEQVAIATRLLREQGGGPLSQSAPQTGPLGFPLYLSLVAGELQGHATWPECQARVHRVAGARFKKCTSLDEARGVVRGWGLKTDVIAALIS